MTPIIGVYMFIGMSDSPKRSSFRSRIAALAVNETASECQRFALGFTDSKEMLAAVEKMRNAANPGVQFAKSQTGGEYIVESGDFRTKSYDIIAVVAVTRTR